MLPGRLPTAPAPSASQSAGRGSPPGLRALRRWFILFALRVRPAGLDFRRFFLRLAIRLFPFLAGFTRAYKAPVFFRRLVALRLALPVLRRRRLRGALAGFVVRRRLRGAAGFVRGRCDFAFDRLRFFLRLARAAAFWRLEPKYFICFALSFLAILRPFFAGFAILVSMVAVAMNHPRFSSRESTAGGCRSER